MEIDDLLDRRACLIDEIREMKMDDDLESDLEYQKTKFD